MNQYRSTIRGRIRLGAITWVAFLVGLRLLILQPERCGTVTAQEVRAAALATVGWLTVNQADDGELSDHFGVAMTLRTRHVDE